jgi:hypothetical protein
MLSRNSCTTVFVVNGWLRGMKWAYFVSLSKTTKMVSFPSDLGKPSIESIVRHWSHVGYREGLQ